MRWLVNGICFSFSLFLQQQLREKNKKSPSKTCCMNSVFHLSAGGLKPEHGEKHAEDKMPRRAVSFSPLAFCVHWFTFSSESIFSLTSLPGGESNYRCLWCTRHGWWSSSWKVTYEKALHTSCLNSAFHSQTLGKCQEFKFTWQLLL